MKKADELIKTIKIDEANFEYCAKHKVINGTLLVEIKRVMNKFASQNPERVMMDLLNKIRERVRSLDKSDNQIYRNNKLLILFCYANAMEIIENYISDLCSGSQEKEHSGLTNTEIVNKALIYYESDEGDKIGAFIKGFKEALKQ